MALTKVTTGTIADDAVTTDKISDNSIQSLKNRNLIINGAMRVAQRGTSATIGNPTFVCDRFRLQNTTVGSFTASQSTNAPDGFSNSLRIYCDTAEASPAAGDIFLMYYRPEGQDLQHIQKGTSGAKSLTVSFWVRSNKTGTYCNWLFDYNNSRSYTTSYSISSADTWTYVTQTFAGDTTGGTLNNDTLRSMELSFGFSSGTNFSSGALTNAWAAHSATNIMAGQTNLADTVGNYWEITGVQLEVGDVATPFEHESYGDTLHKCRRYFQKNRKCMAFYGSSTNIIYNHNCTPEMRATPSLSLTSTSPYWESVPWTAVGTLTGATVSNGHMNSWGGDVRINGSFSPAPSTFSVIKENTWFDAEL